MPVNNSPYDRSERKRIARKMYLRGASVSEVSRKLKVTWITAQKYRDALQDELTSTIHNNPELVQDILTNTYKLLEELDQIRSESWKQYSKKDVPVMVKNQLLNTMLKAQDQRGKLLQVMGLKQEMLIHLQMVRGLQERIIEFMSRELCHEDRDKMEAFLRDNYSGYINDADIVEGEVLELPTG